MFLTIVLMHILHTRVCVCLYPNPTKLNDNDNVWDKRLPPFFYYYKCLFFAGNSISFQFTVQQQRILFKFGFSFGEKKRTCLYMMYKYLDIQKWLKMKNKGKQIKILLVFIIINKFQAKTSCWQQSLNS